MGIFCDCLRFVIFKVCKNLQIIFMHASFLSGDLISCNEEINIALVSFLLII